MSRKIAILRGINVGGNRKILMNDLKSMFENMNFSNIKTYIQSGNVLFETYEESDNLELSQRIEKAINNQFGFDIPVILRTSKELQKAISHNPFYDDEIDVNHLHLTFLSGNPTNDNKVQAESYHYEPDRFVIDNSNVFIYCEGKYHESKLTNSFFESKLKVRATTRNWKTVLKLYELSKED